MCLNARKAALEALTGCRRRGARPEYILSHSGLSDPREMSLAVNIVNGVLQNRTYLDYVIAATAQSFKKLQPIVLDILRLSAYQILFLDRVPNRAAVSEGVDLCKAYAPHASGLVNAVLRRVSEKGNLNIEDKPAEEYLSIRYSHPVWLVRQLSELYGDKVCEEILIADNSTPPVAVQVNTMRTTAEGLAEALTASGVNVKPCPILPDALYLADTGAVEELEEFKKGLFYVQDPAARLVTVAAGVTSGEKVLDLCAAPGGKSFAAAIAMGDKGEVRAYDIHEKKLGLIVRGAQRLGLSSIKVAAGDASRFDPRLEAWADAVLCDVPCSGTGVIRKKPEIRYKAPEDIEGLYEIQLAILKNASRYVKPGGRLLYSTCSILKRENEDVTNAFLRENGSFEPVPFELPEPFGRSDGQKTILPSQGGTDGFFICVLRKK